MQARADQSPAAPAAKRVDVIVVGAGAGFGGLYAIYKFREMGLKVQGFETGGDGLNTRNHFFEREDRRDAVRFKKQPAAPKRPRFASRSTHRLQYLLWKRSNRGRGGGGRNDPVCKGSPHAGRDSLFAPQEVAVEQAGVGPERKVRDRTADADTQTRQAAIAPRSSDRDQVSDDL